MSTAIVYHPGLIFATLVVHFAATKGAQALVLYPRRGGSECEPPDHVVGCSSAPAPPPTKSAASPPSSTKSSQTRSSAASTTGGTSSSTGVSSMSGSSSSSSSSSTLPTPQLIVGDRHDITTGGVIGVALGSAVVAGLALLLFGICLRRRRKARKISQGIAPPAYLPPSASQPQSPVTEMSQTQSSPLISSAVAARLTSTAPAPYPQSLSASTTNTTNSSQSPLIPATSLSHSHSIASSSNRSTSLSYTDGGSHHHHEPLQELPSAWSGNSIFATLGAGAIGSISATSSSPEPSEPSVLHRAMTYHQKALEDEDRKETQAAPSTPDEIDISDPPPKYDA